MVTRDIEASIRKSEAFNRGSHDVQSPAYGTTQLMKLRGEIDALLKVKQPDALLFSQAVQVAMPRIKGRLWRIDQWTKQVSQMAHFDVPKNGADSCL